MQREVECFFGKKDSTKCLWLFGNRLLGDHKISHSNKMETYRDIMLLFSIHVKFQN